MKPDESDWGRRLYAEAELTVIRERRKEMDRRAKAVVEAAGVTVLRSTKPATPPQQRPPGTETAGSPISSCASDTP
jgi:hypothetical protein